MMQRRPEKPSPVAPPAPSAKPQAPPEPEIEISPEEKVAALMAGELSLARQLIEAFPRSEQPYVLLGGVYRRRGAIDEAVSAWEKAVQMNPARSDVYGKIAQAAFEIDEFDKAISLWRQALATDPSMRGCHVSIGRALMRLGQYEECLPEIREEIKLNPTNTLSHFILGRAHQHLQDYEQAKASYEKVIALKPDHTNAYYGLYNVCARLKQQDDAKRYLAEFQRLKERDVEETHRLDETIGDLSVYSKGLARLSFDAHSLYLAQGNVQRAEELLKKAIDLDPRNTVFIERLVVLYQARNRLPEALALCRRIAEIDPENATCQLNIGILSGQLRRFDDAQRAFTRAIELSPEYYGGYQELARLYLRAQVNLPQARKLAERAVALEPNAGNLFLLGLACLANKDTTGALPALKRAAELEPQNAKYTSAYQNTRRRMLSK